MLVRIFLIMLLIPSLCFGANYYVDPTYKGSNGSPNGSFLRPWTNMSGQVNAHSFSASDRLYFKSGTVTPMDAQLHVRWHGTENNRAIVGTYFGEDNFGNGNVLPSQRAVLDGQNFLIPSPDPGAANAKDKGMIVARNHQGYVTIQDLEIRDSGGMAIVAGNSHQSSGVYPYINQYFVIRNNYFNRSWGASMTIGRSSHNQIINNVSDWSSYGHLRVHPHTGIRERVTGSAIEVTGMAIYGLSEHNLISGNTVSRAMYEGIGANNRTRYATITNNIVYDCGVNIYVDQGRDIIISNNLVYATPDAVRGQTAAGHNNVRQILIEHEWTTSRQFQSIIENVQIYNNYIAGGTLGISIAVYEEVVDYGWKNVQIYNNRLVNNQHNFHFGRPNANGKWADNFIYGNYSFKYFDPNDTHGNNLSPPSFTWNRSPSGTNAPNYFTGGTLPGGNAGNGAVKNVAHLLRQSEWRYLEPGKVTTDVFAIEGKDMQIQQPKKVKNVMITEGGVGR